MQAIENALSYHAELSQKLATADKKRDVPVLGETIYRYSNKMEDVSTRNAGPVPHPEQAEAQGRPAKGRLEEDGRGEASPRRADS